MTMRWKRRLILALVAVIAFSAVPLPNFVVWWPYEPPEAITILCRQTAKVLQIATSAGDNVASLEARLWEPKRKRCGEWRPYVGD
jgi:hypothetical protein